MTIDSGGGHRAERFVGLDILRSLAVLLVVLSHYASAMLAWYGIHPPHGVFYLGDIGVDLFFALSGFLIGRILIGIVARAPTGRALAVFWVRRWMRTLPVYLTWLAVLAVAVPPQAAPARTLLHYATLTQNVWHAMPADGWFAVSWSLTIEEWFYLLFGGAMIIGAAAWPARWGVWGPLAVMLAVPLLLRLSVSTDDYYNRGYWKMVPFRVDEIGYGVVLAWLFVRRSRLFAWPRLAMAVGCVLVLAAWAMVPVSLFRVYVVLRGDLTVIGCALCIPAALRLRGLPRWLDRLAWHGSRLSYALYLVHLTFLIDVAGSLFFQGRVSRSGAVAIAILGAYVAAELLARLVERPVMRLRPPQFRPVPA